MTGRPSALGGQRRPGDSPSVEGGHRASSPSTRSPKRVDRRRRVRRRRRRRRRSGSASAASSGWRSSASSVGAERPGPLVPSSGRSATWWSSTCSPRRASRGTTIGQPAGRAGVDDRARAAVADDDVGRGHRGRQVVGRVEHRRGSRRGGGAGRCRAGRRTATSGCAAGPAVDPVDQPVERVVVGAEGDHDRVAPPERRSQERPDARRCRGRCAAARATGRRTGR